MYQVWLLISLLLGPNVSFASLSEFLRVVLTTNAGLLFLAIGTIDGAALSLILFSLTVVSFPLLFDRDVDFVTAMVTSVRAVVTSPLPMIGWAAIIVILLIVSALPYFPRTSLDTTGAGPLHLASVSADRGAASVSWSRNPAAFLAESQWDDADVGDGRSGSATSLNDSYWPKADMTVRDFDVCFRGSSGLLLRPDGECLHSVREA
jgi:hypothetical protein